MSFPIPKKNTRRAIGIIFALCITGTMTLGFLQSYQQAKQRQVHKVDLVEVAIFADKPAAEAILYEAVPTEECIKQLSFEVLAVASSTSAVQFSSSSFASSIATASISSTAKLLPKESAKAAIATIKKNPSLPEPPLVPAKSPKCIAQTITPTGYEKLGAQGFVGLTLNLAKTGRVERGEIEKSSGFAELDAAALKQVTDAWQFEPCKKQNIIVACKQHIRFRWEVK